MTSIAALHPSYDHHTSFQVPNRDSPDLAVLFAVINGREVPAREDRTCIQKVNFSVFEGLGTLVGVAGNLHENYGSYINEPRQDWL